MTETHDIQQTTYRERMERRAEKRRDWADSRTAKSTAAHEGVRRIADGIPFGQPILVGHHSERHARRDQDRMHSGMNAAVEHGKMAERHLQAADGIEHALETSVYSDDPDAVERLTEIVAELEAKRDRMKAANTAYRAEHRAELKAMTPYERSCAIPYPSYSLTNLGATIRQKKQRIEQITRDRAAAEAGIRTGGRQMLARYGGECADCGGQIAKGDPMIWFRSTREAIHHECPKGDEG